MGALNQWVQRRGAWYLLAVINDTLVRAVLWSPVFVWDSHIVTAIQQTHSFHFLSGCYLVNIFLCCSLNAWCRFCHCHGRTVVLIWLCDRDRIGSDWFGSFVSGCGFLYTRIKLVSYLFALFIVFLGKRIYINRMERKYSDWLVGWLPWLHYTIPSSLLALIHSTNLTPS